MRMRTSDIWQAKQNPHYVRTEDMYIDTDKPVDQMDLEDLRRTLCAKANGDVLVCESCEAPCKFGRRIVELLKPVEKEQIDVANFKKALGGKKSGMKRHEKSENAYLSAIASGNPKQWFIDNGREVKNSMQRMKQRFGNMTQEEAKAQLAAKNVEIELLVPEKKPEIPEQIEQVEPIPVQSKPVKNADVQLEIHSLTGTWFRYTRIDDAINIEPNILCVARASDVDAICAEIKAAFEIMSKELK